MAKFSLHEVTDAHLPASFAVALALYGCVWLTGRLLFVPLLLLPVLPSLFFFLFPITF